MRGWLITFEGPEGGGKSTQVELLLEHLRQAGTDPLVVREPGSTAVGERIRAILLDGSLPSMDSRTELLLFCAARAELVASAIRPALEAGRIVVCDRFSASTIAYQGYGRGLDLAGLDGVNSLATGGLQPDLVLCLDVPVELGLARSRRARRLDRMESEDLEFHRRVRHGFLAQAEAEPQRWRVIDATQSVEDVAAVVHLNVDQLLREGAAP